VTFHKRQARESGKRMLVNMPNLALVSLSGNDDIIFHVVPGNDINI
jgi:hypothetical protein